MNDGYPGADRASPDDKLAVPVDQGNLADLDTGAEPLLTTSAARTFITALMPCSCAPGKDSAGGIHAAGNLKTVL